ncbi:nitroreductase family protein [Tessaracoccus sp. Y36]
MRVHIYDWRTFRNHRLRDLKGANLTQVEGKLTFHAHSIEKGLSHTDFRAGFGVTALTELGAAMRQYQLMGYPVERIPFVNALSTLKAYIEAHSVLNFETDHLLRVLGPDLLELVNGSTSDLGGVVTVTAASKVDNDQKNFADLLRGRVSVREFATSSTVEARVRDAVRMSLKSPSVCNRQSTRVRIITDDTQMTQVLELQGGMTGYALPPALVVVTADLESFLEPTERNQAFVDGGLFSMSLLLSLEYMSLAACPLNAMMSGAKEDQLRSLVGIESSERLIVFIAVGDFLDSVKVPKSFRNPLSDVLLGPDLS